MIKLLVISIFMDDNVFFSRWNQVQELPARRRPCQGSDKELPARRRTLPARRCRCRTVCRHRWTNCHHCRTVCRRCGTSCRCCRTICRCCRTICRSCRTSCRCCRREGAGVVGSAGVRPGGGQRAALMEGRLMSSWGHARMD